MSDLPPYRLEWQVVGPGGGRSVTRWSGHGGAADARVAALAVVTSGTALDGEVRIAAGASADSPAAAVITDIVGLEEWDCAARCLPEPKHDAAWTRKREREGLRAAILLACRTALARGVAADILARAHAASALTVIALALDGEDPAKPFGPAD